MPDTTPLTPEARLAALLAKALDDAMCDVSHHDSFSECHNAAKWRAVAAFMSPRLITAGVTLDTARQPAPEAGAEITEASPGLAVMRMIPAYGGSVWKICPTGYVPEDHAVRLCKCAAPAPDDAALPLGEPAMHRHDGLGTHHAEAHHRPHDYQDKE